MRDIFRRQRPAELTTPEPAPLSASDPWRPINPRDGTPRLILSWVTTEAGSGFAVDTFNIATRQIAEFYLDGGAAIAALVRQPEGETNGTATQVEVERADALEDALIASRRQRGFAG